MVFALRMVHVSLQVDRPHCCMYAMLPKTRTYRLHTLIQVNEASRPTPIQVVELCGRLPLVIAIAGFMPVVERKGLTADPWEKLLNDLEIAAKEMRVSGEQLPSLSLVLETSFVALSKRKQEGL